MPDSATSVSGYDSHVALARRLAARVHWPKHDWNEVKRCLRLCVTECCESASFRWNPDEESRINVVLRCSIFLKRETALVLPSFFGMAFYDLRDKSTQG